MDLEEEGPEACRHSRALVALVCPLDALPPHADGLVVHVRPHGVVHRALGRAHDLVLVVRIQQHSNHLVPEATVQLGGGSIGGPVGCRAHLSFQVLLHQLVREKFSKSFPKNVPRGYSRACIGTSDSVGILPSSAGLECWTFIQFGHPTVTGSNPVGGVQLFFFFRCCLQCSSPPKK